MTGPVTAAPLPDGRFATYRLVIRAVLRGWAFNTGYKGQRPTRAALVTLAVVVITSNVGGIWALGSFRDQLPDDAAVVGLSLLIVYMQAAGVVVLLQSIGLGQGMIARGLRLVPLTPTERAIAVNVPLMGIALVSVSTVAVPSVSVLSSVMTDGSTGIGVLPFVWVEAVAIVSASAFAGAFFGFLIWSAAATIGDQVSFLGTRVYPVSIAMLAFGASFHLPALGVYVAPEDGFSVPFVFEVLLFWPAAAESVFSREPGYMAAPVVSFVLLGLLTAKVAKAMLPILLRPEPMPRRKFAWTPDGAFPLLRMELARLLRTRRIAAAWGSGFAMGFFGLAAAVISARRDQINFDVTPLLGLIVSIPTGQIVLLARGYSAREKPYQLVVGHDPGRWARAVQGAATLLAAACAVPLLIFLVAYNGIDDGVVRVVAGYLACIYAGAATVGAIALPGRDNAAAEFSGMILVAVASAALATSLVARYDADMLLVPAVQFAVAAGVGMLPGPIERRRWNRSLSPQGHAPINGAVNDADEPEPLAAVG